jgi:hypothetical protein
VPGLEFLGRQQTTGERSDGAGHFVGGHEADVEAEQFEAIHASTIETLDLVAGCEVTNPNPFGHSSSSISCHLNMQ